MFCDQRRNTARVVFDGRHSLPAQALLQALAKASAQFEADVGVQHDLVLATLLQLETPHPFEVDND